MAVELLLRNRQGGELSPQEREVLEAAVLDVRTIPAGRTVVRQGVPVEASQLLVEGMMTRHVDDSGGRRHMVAMHVPGDFVDLHAYALKALDHDVGTLTDVTIAIFPHRRLEQIQAAHAHLTHRLWFLTLIDAAMHRQWVFRLASLSAIARVAHFLCETNARLLAIGRSDGLSFQLPMTQADLGEVCGLTAIHVNRVMRELRERGLCTFRSSLVEIHDLPALVALAEFQPDYLYLAPPIAQRATGKT